MVLLDLLESLCVRVVLIVGVSDRGIFWALSVEILVFASPTGYMLTSFVFSIVN